jgi:hypothetical protein
MMSAAHLRAAMKLPLLMTALIAALLAGCDAKAPDSAPPAAAPDVPATAVPPAAETAPAPVPLPAPAQARQQPALPVASPAMAPSYSYAEPAPQFAGNEPPPPVYRDYSPQLSQPVPIAVPWAPPPMLVEAPPPPPWPDARWTGGYWVWRDRWVWAPGRWAQPPQPQYHWVPPYYEHRQDRVVFVDGFWSRPGVSFVPPPRDLVIGLAVIGAGIALGRPPAGPQGVFVPPPPGSRYGLIVPAPIGTAPAVMTSAPPIVAPGMRVTTIVNDTRNTTIVNNVTNVTIEAPPGSTANHRAVHVSVPAQAHLAAALAPVERTRPVGPPGIAQTPVAPAPVAPAPSAHVNPQVPPVVAPRPPMPPTARVDNGSTPEPRRPGEDARKGSEPVDRSHAASLRSSAPAPTPRQQPAKPAEPMTAPKAMAPNPPPSPPRPAAQPPERPIPQARPALTPRPVEAPKVQPPPARPESHARDAPGFSPAPHPQARPVEPPAPVAKPKADAAKPADAPKKNVDARDEAAKKKERDSKVDPKGEPR